MNGYKKLEIYQMAFDLAIRVHRATFKLPKYESYEQGSQLRKSTKTIKDTIAEGYGRRRYKSDYIRFLIYALSSADEAMSQLEAIIELYEDIVEFPVLLKEYNILSKKINTYINWVEHNWNI